MSATVKQLQQQNTPQQPQQSAETLELLIEGLESLVNRQNAVEETLHDLRSSLSNIKQELISQPSEKESGKIGSVEKRIAVIESTLSEIAVSLDGENLNAASQRVTSAAEKAMKAAVWVTTKTEKVVGDSQQAIRRVETQASTQMQNYSSRLVHQHEFQVEKSRQTVQKAADAAEKVYAKMDEERAITAFSGIIVSLMPIAGAIIGAAMMVVSLILGWQWATMKSDWEAAPFLAFGWWAVVLTASLGTVAFVIFGVKWLTGWVGAWKSEGAYSFPWSR